MAYFLRHRDGGWLLGWPDGYRSIDDALSVFVPPYGDEYDVFENRRDALRMTDKNWHRELVLVRPAARRARASLHVAGRARPASLE